MHNHSAAHALDWWRSGPGACKRRPDCAQYVAVKKSILYLTLAVSLLAAGSARAADGIDQARQRVRAEQQGPLIDLLRSADERRRGIEESIASLEVRINNLQSQLDELRPALEDAKRERAFATGAVAAAEGAYEISKHTLGVNALTLYATGGWTDMFTLMSTSDLGTFASARVYMDSVVDSGTKLVHGFFVSRDQVRREKIRVESDTQKILDRTKKLEKEQQRLISLSESKQRASNELTSAMAARAQALASIQNDPNGFSLIVKSYGAGTTAIRTLVAAAQTGQPVEKSHAGSVWWPVQGRVSTPFGWRIHPIFKYRSYHTGIDIAADYGAPIRAGQPGVVVDVLYLGAYGMVTVIDHGFSLATMYAHQSRVLVHPGERVQAGQVIGAVGCTGWCTGPHVHFEIWSRSNPENPMHWLS